MSYHTVPAVGLDGALADTFMSFNVTDPVCPFTSVTGNAIFCSVIDVTCPRLFVEI